MSPDSDPFSTSRPSPTPPAIELRALRAEELPDVCALINRSAARDGVTEVTTIDELEQYLDQDGLDPALDTRVALLDGQLVAWAYVKHPAAATRIDRAFLAGEVDPDHRGQGIGRELLAWSLERARARMARRTHDLPRRLWVSAYDWQDSNLRLYRRFGFQPVRWFDELLRPLSALPPVRVPNGIVLHPWARDRDEDIRQARNLAFADHWGSEPFDRARWHDVVEGYGGRPDLSVFAVDQSGAVVGSCVNQAFPADSDLTGRLEAWIYNVSTVPAWRGQGLASAMVAWSLGAFDDAGFTHAMLSVDVDSPTGAGRLYQALGFVPVRRSIVYEIEVA